MDLCLRGRMMDAAKPSDRASSPIVPADRRMDEVMRLPKDRGD